MREAKKKQINWKVFLFCLLVVSITAFIGEQFTAEAVESPWYDSIKISLTPPNWVFPVAWTVLFFLIAFSMYFAWTSTEKGSRKKVAVLFGINLALNALWSFLFFELKKPQWAFFELLALWISIISLIYITWNVERKSSWLLFPYWLWVSFAGILNYLIAFG